MFTSDAQVYSDNTLRPGAMVGRYRYDRERKLGHRRIGEGGQITYKKIETTQLMGSIQLGIQHSVRDFLFYVCGNWLNCLLFVIRRSAVWRRNPNVIC